LQVYNDIVYDLLSPPNRSKNALRIREAVGTPSSETVSQARGILDFTDEELCSKGEEDRALTLTPQSQMNERSSRSHALLQLTVTGNAAGDVIFPTVTRAKLNLVDLAGSEKWSKGSDGGSGCGEQERERIRINYSLSALGHCIAALGETGRRHVPFRDSPLTRLLQDSLVGGKSVVIATVSP
ncbi:unnamed protein product, partial [Discosporangium mesarthrocarpum]